MPKKTPATQTTETSTRPAAFAEQPLLNLIGAGEEAMAAVPLEAYGGQRTAGPAEAQQTGLSLIKDVAGRAQDLGAGTQQAISTIGGQLTGLEAPQISDVDVSRVGGFTEQAMRPILEMVNEQLIPQLQSQSVAQGAFGGERAQSILPSLISRDVNRQVGDLASKFLLDEYRTKAALMPQLEDCANPVLV